MIWKILGLVALLNGILPDFLQPKPADVVLLAGAKIHQLAGGRSTQDIKRGFAIIESAGITRYFVTSTAQEYTLWTREISSVLGSYERILVPNNAEPGGDSSLRADNNITRVSTFDSSDSLDSPVRDIASANSDRGESGIIRRIALGDKLAATKNRIGATKNKIGSAIKTARQNRRLNSAGNMELETDISEHGHNPDSANEDLLDFNYTKIDCDDDLVATLLEKKETDTDVAQDIFSSAAVGAGSDVGKTDVNSGGGGGVDAVAPRRRLQFGQNAIGSRIGSAGSRIGSAIQNVRQKGLDTPEQAEQRPLAGLRGKFRSLRGGGDTVGDGDGSVHANSNSLHGISQNSSPWTCEKCTFINNSKMLPVPQTSCELCGSERIVGNQLATNDTPDSAEPLSKNTLPSSSHQPLSTGQDAGADSAQTNLESSRLGRLGSFGTAVARSARMKLGQRSSMNSNESIFEGGAITLKNVHASGHPPSVSGVDAILVPLKKFVGLWTVSVKPGRLTLGTNPQTVNDSGGMLKVKMANEEEKSSFGAMNSTESTTGPEKLHRVDSGVNGNSSVPNIQLDTESIDDKEQDQKEIFRFGVFRADQVEMKPAIERIFSLGDVLQLHAQISESLERMLPQLINEEVQAEKSGSRATGQGSQKLTTLFSVEKVMVTGRILGGLLDLEESSDITAKTRSYHGKLYCDV